MAAAEAEAMAKTEADAKVSTLHPILSTLNPQPETHHPEPWTLTPQL